MTDWRAGVGDVMKGDSQDFAEVLAWLEREHERNGGGFWNNRRIIQASCEEHRDFWVVRRDGEAIAFQVGDHAPDIVAVREDMRGFGCGTALTDAALARATRAGVSVLRIECSPRSSLTFWERHGFERYGDPNRPGSVTARRVLEHDRPLPADRPVVDVMVGFWPPRADWEGRAAVQPLTVEHLRGAVMPDGAIHLERRVAGLAADMPRGNDFVVGIDVDGEQRCFAKARYDEAEAAGVVRERSGDFHVEMIPAP